MNEQPGRPDDGYEIRLAWPQWATDDAKPVNQVAITAGLPVRTPDGVNLSDQMTYVVFGHALPPLSGPGPELSGLVTGNVYELPISVQSAVCMPFDRLVELHTMIGEHIQKMNNPPSNQTP